MKAFEILNLLQGVLFYQRGDAPNLTRDFNEAIFGITFKDWLKVNIIPDFIRAFADSK